MDLLSAVCIIILLTTRTSAYLDIRAGRTVFTDLIVTD